MWMTNRLNPAQEHLTSNIITRKIAVAYEQLSTPESKDSKVLLFLPEGEIHDLALLYVQYLLKAQGVETIYLGANTPIKDAIYVCQVKAPTHVYIHLTSVTDSFDVKRFIEITHKSFPNAQVLVSGSLLKGKKLKLYKNIQYLFSLSDVKSVIYNNIA
jgi:methanogenic corrinoid protein MtbC1